MFRSLVANIHNIELANKCICQVNYYPSAICPLSNSHQVCNLYTNLSFTYPFLEYMYPEQPFSYYYLQLMENDLLVNFFVKER